MRDSCLALAPVPLSEATAKVRAEARVFLAAEGAAGVFEPRVDAWLSGVDPGFEKKLAHLHWLGMIWPRQYGGHDRSAQERYAGK